MAEVAPVVEERRRMMHAYFFSLTIILETEIRNHPVLVTGAIIADLQWENNQ